MTEVAVPVDGAGARVAVVVVGYGTEAEVPLHEPATEPPAATPAKPDTAGDV